MIKTKYGYIKFNYGNIYNWKIRDEPKGAFGKGASKKRLKIAKQLNELGDMLSIEFPRSLEIAIRGTATEGTVFRFEHYQALKDRREMFDIITKMLGYKVVRETRDHLYLK